MSETVHVDLGARAYDVVIGAGVLARAGEWIAPFAPSGRVFIVTDEHVAKAHLAALERALAGAGLARVSIVLAPGESQKSFAGLERLCDEMLAHEIGRKDIILAFGGGVIGDLAGFAAGIVKRGVDFVQMPTSLLAQVDSSVGGKTAIDTPRGKNLIGLFHQPRLVLADLDVLKTLPPREMLCGYAEIVKYGLIDMPAFYEWCEANAQAVLAGDTAALAHAVRVSVEAKARIVAADEREEGPRALLNLGHTFAHALETAAGYDGALLHGEAVGAGMALAFELSARLGLCPRQDSVRVANHLRGAGFARDLRTLPGGPYDAGALLGHMANDKKTEGGRLTLILARGIGQAFIQKGADGAQVRRLLQDELAPAGAS
ncbi:MAG TPA: 3-dehydroquinate synthase [Caulobacterales bacterium]|jgi:3-dehydroquinate synthase|nr:3-dehydroquinate synthase [Caulobacterales bacterium]